MHWLDLGGGAGINNNCIDGLSLYKKGWSTKPALLTFAAGFSIEKDIQNTKE
jgi:hypothetical protein